MNEQEIKNVLQEIYPDRWEYTDEYITIYFPEITIRNSQDFSHIVYDLYVRYYFKPYLCYNLYGIRATRSNAELSSVYVHSHLYGRQENKWDSFCLGTSNLLYIIDALNNEFDIDTFTIMLHNLKNYVAWENTNGAYRMMHNIGYSSNVLKNVQVTKDIKSYYQKVLASIPWRKYISVNSNSGTLSNISVDTNLVRRLLFQKCYESDSMEDKIAKCRDGQYTFNRHEAYPIMEAQLNEEIVKVQTGKVLFTFNGKEVLESTYNCGGGKLQPPNEINNMIIGHLSIPTAWDIQNKIAAKNKLVFKSVPFIKTFKKLRK